MKLDGLLGRTFDHGRTDCYSLMCDFFRLNFGLEFPDVVRPNDWWEPDAQGRTMNIYMDGYRELGFELVNEHPMLWRPGDVILMAVRSSVANHGGILLPGGKILHHLYGQISCIEDYSRPFFRNQTVAVLRHPGVDHTKLAVENEIDAWDLVPQRVRDRLEQDRQGTLDV